MPRGIYVKKFSEVTRGDIVAICLDSSHRQQGIKNHYLKFGFGCAGSQPLIKQVMAIPGDKVTLTDHSLAVNGKIYAYPTFYRDHLGNPLSVFPRGTYSPTHHYWLLGTHNAHSWDSRYWGPIPHHQIIENLKPLLIWL